MKWYEEIEAGYWAIIGVMIILIGGVIAVLVMVK
jgi:hypothetical protein